MDNIKESVMEQDSSKTVIVNKDCVNQGSANQEQVIDIFSCFIKDKIDSLDDAETFIKSHVGDAADMVIKLIKTSNCR